MRLPLFLILLFTLGWSNCNFAKTSHLLIVEPQYNFAKYGANELNYFKITLFNKTKSDSLVLPRYNNCLVLKGKLDKYNGDFIHYGKTISYSKVRIEHPRYLTQEVPLITVDTIQDSIDVFNKRHHILIHKTVVQMEEAALGNRDWDYLFWSKGNPYGGYFIKNQFVVAFKDSLPFDSIENIGNKKKLDVRCITYDKKMVIYQLRKKELKFGKNSILKSFLNDTNLVQDVGVLIDSVELKYISAFCRVNALALKEIERKKLQPVAALGSLSKEMAYIKNNNLEMGCGLYRIPTGFGYGIVNWQQEVALEQASLKCKQRKELLALDLEFITLHTITYSMSGGKEKGKKRVKNIQKMEEIKKEEKELMKHYMAPFGFIEPVIISIN